MNKQITSRKASWIYWLLILLMPIFIFKQEVIAASKYTVNIAGYTFDPKVTATIPKTIRLSQTAKATYQQRSNYYLVQLRNTLTQKSRFHLVEQYQLELMEYIPELTYLEKLPPQKLDKLVKDKYIRAIVPFQSAFKISPDIGKIKFRSNERKALSGLFLQAILFKEASPNNVTTALKKMGANKITVSDLRSMGSTIRIQFIVPNKKAISEIAKLDEVRWIEEIAEYDEDNGNTAGTMQSGTPGTTPVWDIGIHGEGQIISVMEGRSTDTNHCMFNDPVNPVGPTHRKIQSTFASVGAHATFVAGIAVGNDINNPGTGANRGNAWAARLVNTAASTINMLTQLNSSAGSGAFIHTNSWHARRGTPTLYDQIAADVDNFIWLNEDHVVLGSMGNNGEEQGPPGTAKNALGLNAGTVFPNIMNVGDGNPGPTAGGRRKPDVVTPGCSIQSARSGTACTINQWAVGICATSWATPAAAAATALIRQYYVDGYYPDGAANPTNTFTPSGALIKATLINSAVDMTGIAGYPSITEGWGLVRLDNALFFQNDQQNLKVWDTRNSNGLTTGGTRTHLVTVAGNTEPLKVTLVWSDAPGTVGVVNPTVNNLNLRVISPGGSQIYLGNWFIGGTSVTGGAADAVNNVEQVVINNPGPGQWQVVVDANSVNVGNQGYAVVATSAAVAGPVVMPLWYFGLGLGLTNTEIDSIDTLSVGGLDTDDSDTALKIFAARRLSPNFAIELGLIDLGNYSQENPTNSRTEFDAIALYGDLVGRFEIHTNWYIFGKLGLALSDVNMDYTNFSVSSSGSSVDISPVIGMGFEYGFPNTNWLLRGEWEQYQNVGEGVTTQHVPAASNLELNGQDINILGISLMFEF